MTALKQPVALVTGANRGIGLELVRQYAADGWDVIGTCRNPGDADELQALAAEHDGVSVEQLDLSDLADIDTFADRIGDRTIDVLFNNAGTMGELPLEDHIHKQRFGGLDYDLWAELLLINTLGTVKLTERLTDNVAASDKKIVVMVSSTAGSIGDSDRTAMAYTTSKAALNKASTIIARTLKPRDVIVLVLCPGHVKTRLGIGGASLEIEDSVSGVRDVVAGLTMADTGTFRRYNGETIGW